MSAPVPDLERAFRVVVHLGPLQDHGMTRAGHRRVVPIVGGSVSGAFEAEILPGGADWQIVRADGSIEVDAQYSARTPSGALVLLHATGVRTGPPDVLAALLRGESVDSSEYYFRTVVRIETSDATLAPLQHALFLAAAVREAERVTYTAYRVT
ncbi:Protein of unknown function [Microbacterium sp. cf046]|uniref:DUF3237 domain-containing protein n=1 Tax=Microbacterium sp. cf046 TaxID=1761803 RepID=UPI0008E0A728|nr:DUF3237 domain-containing protein [Microbacterium sp. cf046]SFS14427.1 Protein of unknown function [Microbacterium sp. cf046]